MKASNVLPVLEELPDGSHRSAISANPKARRNNTDAIPVRLIEYTVTTGDNTSDFRLITTTLDPDAAPAHDLAELYERRWGKIESCFDELKTHQRGAGIVLRSKTPTGYCRKCTAASASTTPCGPLISEVALLFEEDDLRFSFTHTIRAARRTPADRPVFSS